MGIYVIIIKKRNNTKIAYTGERRKFGKPQVDLFAGAKLTHWQLWFSLTEWDSVLGEDAEAHDLYYHLLYAFLPLHYINSLMTVLWCLWKRHGTAINHNSTRAKLVIPTVEVPAAAHGGCWTEMGISKICLYVSNHLRKKSGITTCSGNKLSLQSLLATWVHCDLCLNLSFMPRSYYQIVWTSWLTLQRSMKVNLQSVPCCMCSALLNISHMIQLFICHSGKMFV